MAGAGGGSSYDPPISPALHDEHGGPSGGDDGPTSDEHEQAMWAGQSNIMVAVRSRPLLSHDRNRKNILKVLDRKMVVIMDPGRKNEHDPVGRNRSREKKYAFDHAFDPEDDTETVYNHTTRFLIYGVLNGFNATVFAYGCTGAGKTYTMLGTPESPGIMALTLQDMFSKIMELEADYSKMVAYKVLVSFLEIYNENIRDLLCPTPSTEYLDLREDPVKGPTVSGITEIEASSSAEIMGLLARGNTNRTMEATAANAVSSRSHAVLQVIVEERDKAPGAVAEVKVGKLSLIDLAGSERASTTNNRGQRLIEGANINRSLLALGNCINALGEKASRGAFVPYRDSKLTRLLKDSLGGNCRTVMIANISGAVSSFEETLNTLKYANRAKNIKTTVKRNVLNVNYHISEYKSLIGNLRSEITGLKVKLTKQNTQASSKESQAKHQVTQARQEIVGNFKERMQLRRSLIELEDQNVQNSLEVSQRQLQLVEWETLRAENGDHGTDVPEGILNARAEMEQFRKAIEKNHQTKRSIAKRLRHCERHATKHREELISKVTGEERHELMGLEYRIGKLELENMELEQSRIVHDSLVRGKDLTIQKLQMQLQVRERVIAKQREAMTQHGIGDLVDYSSLAIVSTPIMATGFDTLRATKPFDLQGGASRTPTPSQPRGVAATPGDNFAPPGLPPGLSRPSSGRPPSEREERAPTHGGSHTARQPQDASSPTRRGHERPAPLHYSHPPYDDAASRAEADRKERQDRESSFKKDRERQDRESSFKSERDGQERENSFKKERERQDRDIALKKDKQGRREHRDDSSQDESYDYMRERNARARERDSGRDGRGGTNAGGNRRQNPGGNLRPRPKLSQLKGNMRDRGGRGGQNYDRRRERPRQSLGDRSDRESNDGRSDRESVGDKKEYDRDGGRGGMARRNRDGRDVDRRRSAGANANRYEKGRDNVRGDRGRDNRVGGVRRSEYRAIGARRKVRPKARSSAASDGENESTWAKKRRDNNSLPAIRNGAQRERASVGAYSAYSSDSDDDPEPVRRSYASNNDRRGPHKKRYGGPKDAKIVPLG
jgi:kinesin family protein 18/19